MTAHPEVIHMSGKRPTPWIWSAWQGCYRYQRITGCLEASRRAVLLQLGSRQLIHGGAGPALHLSQPPGSGTRLKRAEGLGFTATAISRLFWYQPPCAVATDSFRRL